MNNPEETGKVKYFCRSRGHGFITPDNGSPDVFVHISELVFFSLNSMNYIYI